MRRRSRRAVLSIAGLATLLVPALLWAQEPGQEKAPPSGGPEAAPRSRLTLSGNYTTEAFNQKNFFLGARPDTFANGSPTGYVSNKDAYWIQELTLQPRIILADNLNLTLSLTAAQGIWGLDAETPDHEEPGYTNLFNKKDANFLIHVDWAYAAYRNAWSKTRWYVGRQRFGLGNMLALDADAGGIQVFRDLRNRSWLGLGYAKMFEGTNGLTDENFNVADSTRPGVRGPDGRDADLFYAVYNMKSAGGNFTFSPFAAYYIDKHAADSTSLSYLPQQQEYLDARFRPNISNATVLGVSAKVRRGMLYASGEYDMLKGKDKIPNPDSGEYQLLDRNNGDLTGSNLLIQAGLEWPKLQIGGTLGMGSGDADPRLDEGNINFLRNQGGFSLLEVWGNGLALDERAPVPQGMGNPFVRSYRGLENMKIYQGSASYLISTGLKVAASYSVIRSAQPVAPYRDLNHDGRITLVKGLPPEQAEYRIDPAYPERGFASDTDIGTEIDLKVDWSLEKVLTLWVHGGMFTPGPAAGYIVSGTAKYQEKATQIRVGATVPIREFSLGG
jgi:hypothetical protein